MRTDKQPYYMTLPFAAGVCVLLLLLSMIPGVSALILKFDHFAFIRLNALITKSYVFDHFLRFFVDSDHNFLFFIIAIVLTIIVIGTSADPHKIISRYSSLIFILIVLGVTMLLEDQVDRFIERRSPSYSQIPFINIGEVYKWRNFDITDKKTFPSDEALIFLTIGFMLLRLGYRRLAIPVIMAGLIIPVGLCMTGIAWMSDIYLGHYRSVLDVGNCDANPVWQSSRMVASNAYGTCGSDPHDCP